MKYELGFVFCVEAGHLEQQAILLLETIRAFAGRFRESLIWAVQPRRGKRLSQKTLDTFADLNATFIYADLNQLWAHYNFANKVYTAAFIEELALGKVDTLCWLDSDMICAQPPEYLLLHDSECVAVRPVHFQELGLSADNADDQYWDVIFEVCGTDRSQLWDIETTVDQRRVFAYFQAGLIAVKPNKGIFGRWKENLELLAKDNKRIEILGLHRKGNFFIEQALLAATILSMTSRSEVRLLDHRYNYPLPFQKMLPADIRSSLLNDLVVIHYHNAFYNLHWLREIGVKGTLREILLTRLPLKKPKTKTASWYLRRLRELGWEGSFRKLWRKISRTVLLIAGVIEARRVGN